MDGRSVDKSFETSGRRRVPLSGRERRHYLKNRLTRLEEFVSELSSSNGPTKNP